LCHDGTIVKTETRREKPVTTYTIAYDNVLFAVVRDGEDVIAAAADYAKDAGVEFDDIEEGDDIVWQGASLGVLTDEGGRAYTYAVIRS
jgi:hypothetical protein